MLFLACVTVRVRRIFLRKKRALCKDSVVYEVPHSGCSKAYKGGPYRDVRGLMNTKRMYPVRHHRTTSSFVTHIENCQQLPGWKRTAVLWSGRDRGRRKVVEAAVIGTMANFSNKRWIICTLASILPAILLNEQVNVT